MISNKPSEEVINNVLNGLASEEEAKIVAEWFSSDEGQTYLSAKIDMDFLSIKEGSEDLFVGHYIPSDKIYELIEQHIRKKKMKRILFRVAAVLFPVIFISGLFFQLNSRVDLFGNGELQEIYIPKGERAQFLFQDGTRAYINSDTKIYYPKQFGLSDRTIRIIGEAYFEVAPNKNRPFIVELEKGSIRVLGTSFNVEAYPEYKTINVTLDEGKINLISWTKEENFLNKGEKIVYNKETGECTKITDEKLKSASSWKKDVITFTDTPLAEVIERLNRWYDIDFVVENNECLKYCYTFTSENTLLENVLNDLEKVAPVRFVYENDIVRIRME